MVRDARGGSLALLTMRQTEGYLALRHPCEWPITLRTLSQDRHFDAASLIA